MSEERLKRVEVLLETCAKMTVKHDSDIKELREQMLNLTLHMDSLTQMFQESVGVIKTMQSEIRGIQTENQRMLQRFFGESQE